MILRKPRWTYPYCKGPGHRTVYKELSISVNVTVSMSCDRDRLFPAGNKRLDALNEDRSSENGTVKDSSDSSVRALPHRVEVILGHSLSVRCDSSALNCNAELISPVSCIDSNLVSCLVSVLESQVEILGLQINIRQDDNVLYLLPDNSCHLVPVHLYEGGLHLNLSHKISILINNTRRF